MHPFSFNTTLARRFLNMVRPWAGHRAPIPHIHAWEQPPPEPRFDFLVRHHQTEAERTLSGSFTEHMQAIQRANADNCNVLVRLDAGQYRFFCAWFGAKPETVRYGFRDSALPLAPSIEINVGRGSAPLFDDRTILIWLCESQLAGEQIAAVEYRLTQRWSASRFVGSGVIDIPLPGSMIWHTEPSPVSDAERLAALKEIEELGTDEQFQLALRTRSHPNYTDSNRRWAQAWTRSSPAPPRTTCAVVGMQGDAACGERATRYSVEEEIDAKLIAPLHQAVNADTYAP